MPTLKKIKDSMKKLKLKEINSSPLNTNGEKPCKFTFEVLD
ncbi:MAG: hypothetical protein K0S01_479 [Herbinix sp.]|nr:hypothetical protein [Herbinix sp.]